MNKTAFLAFVLCLFITPFLSAQQIDGQASIVNFSVSNMGLKTVKGTFGGMKGELRFDAQQLDNAYFNVCIDAASVNTGNKKRDHHLLNEDFFEVDKYPVICFESSKIVKTDSGYKAMGTLKMHGVSKAIELPFSYNNKSFNGQLEIDRFDYGIGASGGFMVGREVMLDINCIIK